ncbi:hypothetical protein E4U12_000883, partial [Claviceps purpurea]
MVPEDEGQAWIEVPACDGLTEWATDVFRARERLALGFVSDLLDTVAAVYFSAPLDAHPSRARTPRDRDRSGQTAK